MEERLRVHGFAILVGLIASFTTGSLVPILGAFGFIACFESTMSKLEG